MSDYHAVPLDRKNWKKRNKLIEPFTKAGVIDEDEDHVRFEGLTVEVLEKLIKLKFADPSETQNESPSIKEFLEYMKEHDATAEGYIISAARGDYRVSVEGVSQVATDLTSRRTFFDTFRHADELDVFDDVMRCWYD